MAAVLSKAGVKGINGNAAAVRISFILIAAWFMVFAGGRLKEVKLLDKTAFLFLFLSGLAAGLSWVFYFKALETGDVSKVAPVDKFSVVIVMILAFIFLREPVSFKTVLGGLLTAAGTLILVL